MDEPKDTHHIIERVHIQAFKVNKNLLFIKKPLNAQSITCLFKLGDYIYDQFHTTTEKALRIEGKCVAVNNYFVIQDNILCQVPTFCNMHFKTLRLNSSLNPVCTSEKCPELDDFSIRHLKKNPIQLTQKSVMQSRYDFLESPCETNTHDDILVLKSLENAIFKEKVVSYRNLIDAFCNKPVIIKALYKLTDRVNNIFILKEEYFAENLRQARNKIVKYFEMTDFEKYDILQDLADEKWMLKEFATVKNGIVESKVTGDGLIPDFEQVETEFLIQIKMFMKAENRLYSMSELASHTGLCPSTIRMLLSTNDTFLCLANDAWVMCEPSDPLYSVFAEFTMSIEIPLGKIKQKINVNKHNKELLANYFVFKGNKVVIKSV